MLVCQSFSKSFGLYGERVGGLQAVCPSETVASAVHDQLRYLIRSEFSSSPAFGARLVTYVLSDLAREHSGKIQNTVPELYDLVLTLICIQTRSITSNIEDASPRAI